MANHPYPRDSPRSLGEALFVATQQQPGAAQPHIENTYGPEITRRLAERPRQSITAATTAAVSSWCARRSRSTDPPSTGGVMMTPRLRSEQSRTPPQLLQLELGAPVERPHLSSVPTTTPAERPSGYNSSLIAGMPLDGNWSGPPPSMMTAGVLPPLPSLEDSTAAAHGVPNDALAIVTASDRMRNAAANEEYYQLVAKNSSFEPVRGQAKT